jgi:hypothetical protein
MRSMDETRMFGSGCGRHGTAVSATKTFCCFSSKAASGLLAEPTGTLIGVASTRRRAVPDALGQDPPGKCGLFASAPGLGGVGSTHTLLLGLLAFLSLLWCVHLAEDTQIEGWPMGMQDAGVGCGPMISTAAVQLLVLEPMEAG